MESSERTSRAEFMASRFIAQRETGPWSDQDAAQLDAWLAEATLHQVIYYRLHAAWDEAGRLKALGGDSSATRSDRGPRNHKSAPWYAIAATLVLAVAASAFIFRDTLLGADTYRTKIGGLEAVPLADGSRVTLNTDSIVRVALNDSERRIDLQKGEAFFEVAKDPNRPFVVSVGNQRVVAVGTRFSVRRDAEDLEVVVTEGTVRIETAGAPQPDIRLLSAGSIARTHATRVLVEQKPLLDVEQHLTWRTGTLTFRDTSLADAIAEFNRYNKRKIIIRDPAIASLQIGGIFGATQLDAFVRLLRNGFPIDVSEEGDEIILTAK